MDKSAHKIKQEKKLLFAIWGVITILLMLFSLYFTWKSEEREIYYQVEETAEITATKIDKLVDKITQSIYATNITSAEISHCQEALLSKLQHLVLNVPEIAGISIVAQATSSNTPPCMTNDCKQNASPADQPPILCSTLPKDDYALSIPQSNSPLSILGPTKLMDLDKPVFIIQQKVGAYNINIYLLINDIVKLLKPQSSLAELVVLYDNQRQSVLIGTRKNAATNHVWELVPPDKLKVNNSAVHQANSETIHIELVRLQGVEIMIEINQQQVKLLTLRYASLAGLLIFIISFAIYYILRNRIEEHYSIHNAIKLAIKNHEFFPVYQPIMNRKTNTCTGAEVLLRWQTSAEEVIMPDSFIEYTEKTGLIVPITIELTRKVFSECMPLLRQHPNFYLSINLSSAHFTDPRFFKTFSLLCKKFNIPAKQIMLEITERDLLQHDISVIQQMEALRSAGFSIAVDDFGTGNSSISYLQRFPFNYLKIDKLFVSSIGTGSVTEKLNVSIINMANHLSLQVIAEGVETYEQLEALEGSGVFLIQGWYFSKALSFEALQQFIQRNSAT
jgi:sensor c-di-GMP phosphodiesterase-like protein